MPELNTSTIFSLGTTMMVVDCLSDITSNSGKGVVITSNLPITTSTGHILYLKGTQDPTPALYNQFGLSFSTGTILRGSQKSPPDVPINSYIEYSNRYVNPYQCVTLLENPTNVYTVLNVYYSNAFNNYVADPSPTSVVVDATGKSSVLFVDLNTQSKTVLLPDLGNRPSTESFVPCISIKDVYGKADVNSLYISTFGPTTKIERLSNCAILTQPFSEIDLVADYNLNCWHITNYFDGQLTTSFFGATPNFTDVYINSTQSIVDVQANVTPGVTKTVFLPPASTVKGKSFWIRDCSGNVLPGGGTVENITISTIGVDRLDLSNTTHYIIYPFGGLNVYARDDSNYAVMANNYFGSSNWLDPNLGY